MKERPILFSGPMARAILDDRKTMTRRVIKTDGYGAEAAIKNDNIPLHVRIVDDLHVSVPFSCPYGQPGDRLWVRETWAYITDGFAVSQGVLYRADMKERFWTGDKPLIPEGARVWNSHAEKIYPGNVKWRPSIFMPRWASRLTLEITAVRVERLQDISDKDAEAEGLIFTGGGGPEECGRGKQGFRTLWDSLNAKRGYGWDANPRVRVIQFKRVK